MVSRAPGGKPGGQKQLCVLLGGLGQPECWPGTLSVVPASRGLWRNIQGRCQQGGGSGWERADPEVA